MLLLRHPTRFDQLILESMRVPKISTFCDTSLDYKALTRLGITSRFCPFFAVPDSTFPITTVPMSLYLSTMGMMNGPSALRLSDGRASMNGIKAGPSYQGHVALSIGTLSPCPVIPDTGMNVKSFALKLQEKHLLSRSKMEKSCDLPEFLKIW